METLVELDHEYALHARMVGVADYRRAATLGINQAFIDGLARATLEATAWQSREVVDAANDVADVPFSELKVDGGMTADELLMQFQADVLGVPVVRPRVAETTALGAAYLAGLATGYWKDDAEVGANWQVDRRFEPAMPRERVAELVAGWNVAVGRVRTGEAAPVIPAKAGTQS